LIWASAVTGAFLALISTSAAILFLALPIWMVLLIYPLTAGLYTAVIFAILLLRGLPRSRDEERREKDDQYLQIPLVSSVTAVCTTETTPYKK